MSELRHSLGGVDGILVAALLVAFFVGLGSVPLFDRDEGAFSEATREMFDRGDFVSIYLDGEPRYDKPILIYWCQAVFVAVLGPREMAFRLPSAIFAAMWVLAVFRFVRERLGDEAARATAVMMATSFGVMAIGRAAIADALLNFLVTSALLDIYRYHEQPRQGLVLRVFLVLGLGFLTKGPVALLVPGAVSFLFFVSLGRWREWLRAVLAWRGWLVFAVVALPWYVAQFLREGQPWVEGFFLGHNVNRFTDAMEGHGGGFWYYIPVFLLAVLPHTALLLRVLPRVRFWRHDDLDRFAWLWFGFVLVFFTFSSTKLPHYVYLGIVPLFLLMGRYREDLRSRVLALLPAVLLLIGLGALPWFVPIARERLGDPHLVAMLGEADRALGTGYVVACGIALVLVVVLGWRSGRPAWRALIPAGLVSGLCAVMIVMPPVAEVQQGPLKEAALRARELGEPTVRWGLNTPSVGVYRRAPTPDREPRPGELVITKTGNLPRLAEHEIIYRRGGIVLARVIRPR